MHRFVLQTIDPALGCPVLEALLRVADPEALRPLLGPDALEDEGLECSYCLDDAELQAINERFGTLLLSKRVAFVGTGALDAGQRLAPDVHCFTARKHPWVVLPAGVPAFEGDYDHATVWSAEAAKTCAAAPQAAAPFRRARRRRTAAAGPP